MYHWYKLLSAHPSVHWFITFWFLSGVYLKSSDYLHFLFVTENHKGFAREPEINVSKNGELNWSLGHSVCMQTSLYIHVLISTGLHCLVSVLYITVNVLKVRTLYLILFAPKF